MLVLEHDAKQLLSGRGLPVPRGVLAECATAAPPPFPAPWIVKAQVPTGGRGKAGGILRADTPDALSAALASLIGGRLKGHLVQACRVEEAIDAASEAYVSLSVQPGRGTAAILVCAAGGMEVESAGDAVLRAESPVHTDSLRQEVSRLAERLPSPLRQPVRELGAALAAFLVETDSLLVEVNPLFVRADGSWVIGDAKLIADANAIGRQPALAALVRERAGAYPDQHRKQENGFDFVVLDPGGTIGLVTTGAGLSMMLVDEMTGRGLRPFNFCDIRTGQMRGDPKRLVDVLTWISAGPGIRAVLVNIFAGITDLSEFARLLVEALGRVAQLRVPVVARLVGNGAEAAHAALEASGLPVTLEPDLDRAVALAASLAAEAGDA